jgi:hypothetical protein
MNDFRNALKKAMSVPIDAVEMLRKGDVEGHEFHGNQYGDGGGGQPNDTKSTGWTPVAGKEPFSISGYKHPSGATATKTAKGWVVEHKGKSVTITNRKATLTDLDIAFAHVNKMVQS